MVVVSRRTARAKNFASLEDCGDPSKSLEMRDSAMGHLSDMYGLIPGNHIPDTGTFSLTVRLVLDKGSAWHGNGIVAVGWCCSQTLPSTLPVAQFVAFEVDQVVCGRTDSVERFVRERHYRWLSCRLSQCLCNSV